MKEAAVTIAIAAALVGALFGMALLHWGWQGATAEAQELAEIESRPIVPYTPLPENRRFHGVAMQIHNAYRVDEFKRAIEEIAGTGADTLLLSVAAYQEHGASSTITIDARRAPNHEQTVEVLKLARSLRMRVIVMPILLLSNPRGNEWRGKIVPADPDRWWADYREYIKYYARASVEGGADLLMIGSELNKMEAVPERWRDLIKFLRTDYPTLKLGYSSNWDRYWKVAYWDDLDYAGVTTYYTLASREEPTVDEIVEAWKPHMDKLVAWQRTVGRPVIFTEVGWYSRKGTATQPWNYYHNEGKPSMLEQANLYEAFLRVWSGQPMVGGVIFWEWTLGQGGPTDEGYTPKGKLAEKVMRDYFKAHASPTTQPATAPDR